MRYDQFLLILRTFGICLIVYFTGKRNEPRCNVHIANKRYIGIGMSVCLRMYVRNIAFLICIGTVWYGMAWHECGVLYETAYE